MTRNALSGAAAQRCFRVMGCASQVMITDGTDTLLDVAEQRLRELDARWSRFRADSDITRVNQAAGEPTPVHVDTIAVVDRAIEAWKQTAGLFDITVLPALVHHGYTHSANGSGAAPRVAEQRIGVCGEISVDTAAATIATPPGSAIDLGGIGKGFAADMVVDELLSMGAPGALVSVGGDICARGMTSSGSSHWIIGVEDPVNAPALIATIAFERGGVATSGTTVRRWTTPTGETAHHLIDPHTALPATTSLHTATVVAADTSTAEAFATAAMMADAASAIRLLDDVGLAGLMVSRDGRAHATKSWPAFVELIEP